MKNIPIFFTIITFFALFAGCQWFENKVEATDVPSIPYQTFFSGSLGSSISITGYLITDPVPMVVADSIWLFINTPMPPGQYIPLKSAALDSFLTSTGSTFIGRQVTITGTIDTGKVDYLQGKRYLQPIQVETNGPNTTNSPTGYIVDLNDANFPVTTPVDNNKFALLYSGGIDDNQAKNRYWNDLAFMYKTLVSKYGYSESNIVVVYKGGASVNNDMTVDFPASETGLNAAISDLDTKMRAGSTNPQLFVFITNHGGGYHAGIARNVSGQLDNLSSYQDEQANPLAIDETVFYYAPNSNPWANRILLDENMASKINALPYTSLVTLLQPCFSGGLLKDLVSTASTNSGTTQPRRINIAAASEFEYSYSYATYPFNNSYDGFSYLFTAALLGTRHDGSPLRLSQGPTHINPATYDGRGGVTVWEAFWYARRFENLSTHLIDDNFDGVGTPFPDSPFFIPPPNQTGANPDGHLASGVSL
jgi:hypothetical protein